jgi:hypothetical protein
MRRFKVGDLVRVVMCGENSVGVVMRLIEVGGMYIVLVDGVECWLCEESVELMERGCEDV